MYPNPATSTTLQVDYTINYGDNAYITIVPLYLASGTPTQYSVDKSQNVIHIDISGFALGAYKVVLYCDGNMVDSENLIIGN